VFIVTLRVSYNLKACIIQEHINGFQKGVQQTEFFVKDVDVSDLRFDVNKDVVDGKLVSEAEAVLKKRLKGEGAEHKY